MIAASHLRSSQPAWPQRVLAAICALLIGLLSWFAADPTAHGELHAPAAHAAHEGDGESPVGETDHECAVTLFAQGIEALLFFCLLLLARPLVCRAGLRLDDWPVIGRPHYWLVPSQAPPLV